MASECSDIAPPLLRRLLGIAALVAVATFLSCSESVESPLPPDGEPLASQCTADAECADDEFCLHGLCGVEPEHSEFEYGIVIRPPERSVFPPQVVDADLRPVVGADVSARASQVISGELSTTDGEAAPNGTIVANSTQPSLLPEIQRPVRGGEFELHVPSGDYRLTYIVDDDRWPRIPLDVHDLSDDTAPIALTIPTFQELRTVTGELTREPLEIVGLLSEPVEGAEVVARATTSEHRSQVAVTDENGEFALHLPPGDDDFDVLVSPGPDNPVVPYATFDTEIEAATDDVSLSLGELDFDLLSVSLEMSAESVPGHSPDWPAYRADFHQSVDVGDLLVTPVLDDDGTADVELVPGSYDIEITPPPAAPWGSAAETIDSLDTVSTVDIELPLRSRVHGTVIDHRGEPVAHARLRVEPETGSDLAPPAVYTDGDGGFELWLDSGDYNLTVRPPASTALPRHRESFSIDADDEVSIDVQLRRGFVATGRIQASDGTPLSRGSIEIFDDDGESSPTIDDGITGDDGSYRIVVPQP